jgi:hypothetical protein
LSSPIDDYLHALRRELPWPRRRLEREIRAHLEESADRRAREGTDRLAAERAAVAHFGAVAEVAAAVSTDGGPMLSPAARRWIPALAALLTLPTVVFVMVNVIEVLAGNGGGVGVFGDSTERWATPLNLLLSLGPLASLVLIAIATMRVRFSRNEGGLRAQVHVRLSRGMAVLTALVAVVALGVGAYLLSENVFCVPGSWEIC